VDTTNILFIVGGHLPGWRRSSRTHPEGWHCFTSEVRDVRAPARQRPVPRREPENLIKFGLSGVRGRLPVVATLDELDEGH